MHPPKLNISQELVVVLKNHLGIRPRHGPVFAGSLHLSGSSTAEVVVAAIVRETIE